MNPFFSLLLGETSVEKGRRRFFDRASGIKDSGLLEEGELFSGGEGRQVVEDGL